MRITVLTASLVLAIPNIAVSQEKPEGDELHKCDKPIGILAVNEPQQEYMRVFQRYSLGSPAALR